MSELPGLIPHWAHFLSLAVRVDLLQSASPHFNTISQTLSRRVRGPPQSCDIWRMMSCLFSERHDERFESETLAQRGMHTHTPFWSQQSTFGRFHLVFISWLFASGSSPALVLLTRPSSHPSLLTLNPQTSPDPGASLQEGQRCKWCSPFNTHTSSDSLRFHASLTCFSQRLSTGGRWYLRQFYWLMRRADQRCDGWMNGWLRYGMWIAVGVHPLTGNSSTKTNWSEGGRWGTWNKGLNKSS